MIEDLLLVIQRCLKGDEHSWNLFIKEFGSIAGNILRKFHGLTAADYEDIIQNVFLKLIKGGLSNFRGTSKYEFLMYFKKTVINEGITYLRTANKKDIPLNNDDSDGSSPEFLIPDPAPNSRPDLNAEEKEILELIKKVMKGFSLIDQQIFIMKIKEYKDEEIKKILKVPIGTVASKYYRMKAKIKEELEKN